MSPDGVLYTVSDIGFGSEIVYAAVNVGEPPAYPQFGENSGIMWSRNGAAWSLPRP